MTPSPVTDITLFRKWASSTISNLSDGNKFYPGMPSDVYDAAPGVRSSVLKPRTTLEMRAACMKEQEYAYHFSLGTAVHIACLEPDRFDMVDGIEEFFYFSPTKSFDSKGALAAIEAHRGTGKTIVTECIIEKARRMRDAIFAHRFADKLINVPRDTEVSGFAFDPDAQIIRKIRLDLLPHDRSYMVDIKTTRDITDNGFFWQCKDRGYGISAAYYRDTEALITGLEPRPLFYLVAVTGPNGSSESPTDAPYMARVFEIAQGDADPEEGSLVIEGSNIYADKLAKFANAIRTNTWEGYEHEGAVTLTARAPFKH